jgi:hypothetical protein
MERRTMSEPRWVEMLPWFPGYFISDDGRAIGRSGLELSLNTGHKGYLIVNAKRLNGLRTTLRVNRIVCWHFNGPYPDDGIKYQAAHLDNDKTNNNYWNLEWQTPAENYHGGGFTPETATIAAYKSWENRDKHLEAILRGKGIL